MQFYPIKELMDGLNEDDVRRYYSGILIPILNIKKDRVDFSIIEQITKTAIRFRKADRKEYAGSSASYSLPMGYNVNQYVNMDKCAMLVKRIPRRQWKKGLTRNNTVIRPPFMDTLRQYYMEYELIHSMLNPGLLLAEELQKHHYAGDKYYPAYKDAYNKISRGEVGSLAVTPSYAIAVEQSAEHPYLLKNNIPIGWSLPDHVVLSNRHTHLWPQINFTEVRGE